VRNEVGEFFLVQTSWTTSQMTVLEGEAMTLMEDICLSINKGWTHVILEIDSFNLADYISSCR